MDEVRLTPEERKTFEDFYNARVLPAKNQGYAAELEAARDLLEAVVKDGLTPGSDGSQSYVRRGQQDWTDAATAAAAQSVAGAGGRGRSERRGRRPADGGRREMLQGALVLAAVLAVAVWYFFRPSGGETGQAEEAEPAAITSIAEIESGATPTPLPTLEAELLADIIDSSGVKTELVTPRTLEVAGVSFVVQPVQVTVGDWPLPYEERAVSWVYGTVINYVMGVEATPANKELLAGLQTGDELILRMSTGSAHHFGYADAVRVAPQASEIFRQSRPGLTLALLNDSQASQRVVIRANYIPASELGPLPAGREFKAAVGEAVDLDRAVRVTCRGGRLLAKPGASPGYIYQAVDYQVRNVSEVEISTGAFKHYLEVDGMTYPVVAVPHEANPYPAVPETLAPGRVFSTTAVYAAPETTLLEGLFWEFSPGPAGSRARVALPPYPGRLAPVVAGATAQFSGGLLRVTFVISAGLHGLELHPNDIGLEGGTLEAAGSQFPWRAPPNGAGEFLMVLLPGRAGQVAVSLLDRGFEFTVMKEEG